MELTDLVQDINTISIVASGVAGSLAGAIGWYLDKKFMDYDNKFGGAVIVGTLLGLALTDYDGNLLSNLGEIGTRGLGVGLGYALAYTAMQRIWKKE